MSSISFSFKKSSNFIINKKKTEILKNKNKEDKKEKSSSYVKFTNFFQK